MATDTLEPLRLRPILKHRVWGGRLLAELGHALPDERVYGEAWLVSDLPSGGAGGGSVGNNDDRSVVEHGRWAGRTLHEVMESQPRALLGDARRSPEGGFPLLVKLLDARENLSVQVHPTRSYAARHPGAHVKDETWFVLRAAEGAVIYRGLRRRLSRDEFRRRVLDGSIVEDLVALPVKAGDVCDLPSGTCHALGGGVLVAEVQTPSDTTFRLFDWGRQGRELHIDQGVDVLFGDGAAGADRSGGTSQQAIESGDLITRRLCATPNYVVERIEARADATRPPLLPLITDNLPVVLLPLSGSGTLAGGNDVQPLRRGHATLLPACLRNWSAELAPGTALLRIEVPGPTRLAG